MRAQHNRGFTALSLCMTCVFLLSGTAYASVNQESHAGSRTDDQMQTSEETISHYTCGMHPGVRVSVENYKNGDEKCPICFMPLTPVQQGGQLAGDFGENVISKVEIKLKELQLAGIKTEAVTKQQLFKEIRAVGKVAYDPQMAVAQDQFISAIKAHGKAKEGQIPEIIERSSSMIESSKRRLLLLGLNDKQIKEIEGSRQVQTNLILPGDKMWIYGDIYEYELNWVKTGSYVTVRPISLAGEEFFGEVVSINPVVDPQTRSVRIRALIDNPGQRLKPEMYVDIAIMSQYEDAQGNLEVLSIPKSALLDTGRRRIVWVDKGKGQFEGRRVEIGPEAVGHSEAKTRFYPVIKGLQEGERVVTKGNFLIDSQSQITGVAASSYGGSLDSDQKPKAKQGGHVH